MDYKCPSCQRPLQSRIALQCAFCSQPIPEPLLLSKAQRAAQEVQENHARKRLESISHEVSKPIEGASHCS
jgi:hypothetical protein